MDVESAFKAFASGKDVFVSLPTGYSKSLCYQSLPVVFDALRGHQTASTSVSVMVVVSPLVSIMKDQVSDFNDKQVSTVDVTSGMEEKVEEAILRGQYNIVYLSPEQLLTRGKWREMLHSEVYQNNLVGFVVDEAHCVKKW